MKLYLFKEEGLLCWRKIVSVDILLDGMILIFKVLLLLGKVILWIVMDFLGEGVCEMFGGIYNIK